MVEQPVPFHSRSEYVPPRRLCLPPSLYNSLPYTCDRTPSWQTRELWGLRLLIWRSAVLPIDHRCWCRLNLSKRLCSPADRLANRLTVQATSVASSAFWASMPAISLALLVVRISLSIRWCSFSDRHHHLQFNATPLLPVLEATLATLRQSAAPTAVLCVLFSTSTST